MKKLIVIFAVMLLALLTLTACDTPDNSNYINFSSEEYKVVYNKDVFAESIALDSLLEAVKDKTGKELSKINYVGSKESEYEIVFGKVTNRDEYNDALKVMTELSTADIGVYIVKVVGKRLVVCADNSDSYNLAVKYLKSLITDEGFMVEDGLDKVVIYDYKKYLAGEGVHTYTEADLAKISTVVTIALGDELIKDFSAQVLEYTAETDFFRGYPTVVATPSVKGATVSVAQATDENEGVATVTVQSKDKSSTTVYKVTFNMNSEYSIGAEVVNKGGASSAIVFTVDDGDQRTAQFMMEEMLVKYPHLKATFGLVTQKIVTLETEGTAGTESYKWAMDENGRYKYTVNQTVYEFWKKIVDTGSFAVTSHSHTHAYMGDDDNGGVFEYEKSDGTTHTSKYFPKGNVTMEVAASLQIIRDLFPSQSVLGYIKPGTSTVNSDYYYDQIINGGYYISARSTAGSYKNPAAMVNTPEWLATWRNRYYLKGYMIQHYTTNADVATDQSSTPGECLAAGIPAWKNYMDEAVKAGAMACFCIHTIREDDTTGSGHYIFDTQADQLFGYANSLVENGDAWMAFYDEAMIYYNMWSTSKVSAVAYKEDKITVSMTHEEKGDMYDNVPLTVKVSVPASWTSAEIDGNTIDVKTDANGNKYVFCDVVMGENTVINRK